jgi:glycosyltransferase involved in cell wall biosynthesis
MYFQIITNGLACSFMKKVSIILTTYNSGKTLQRTLDSLYSQEGNNESFIIELIVVDDCSIDDTRTQLKNNNIDFLSTNRNSGGPNVGRNMGLDVASGDYICIMDHDDIWKSDKIKSQLEVCDLAPIISTGYTTINDLNGDSKDYISQSPDASGYIIYNENETFKTLLSRSKKGQLTYIGGLMFHGSLKEVKFEEEYAQVDFDWGLRLFQGQKSLEICKPLYIRNIVGNNLSLKEEYRLNDYNFSIKTVKQYQDDYPELIREFYKKINGTMGRYYYHKEEMQNARRYFLKSGISLKNLTYLVTSYYGYKFVNKNFRVF